VRLRDLNPELSGTVRKGVLTHDCPVCKTHRVRTPISNQPFHEESYSPKKFWENGAEMTRKIWHATGVFPDTLTLSPSINLVEVDPSTGQAIRTLCWHGFIQNGAIT
jgi:hypothetical protein